MNYIKKTSLVLLGIFALLILSTVNTKTAQAAGEYEGYSDRSNPNELYVKKLEKK